MWITIGNCWSCQTPLSVDLQLLWMLLSEHAWQSYWCLVKLELGSYRLISQILSSYSGFGHPWIWLYLLIPKRSSFLLHCSSCQQIPKKIARILLYEKTMSCFYTPKSVPRLFFTLPTSQLWLAPALKYSGQTYSPNFLITLNNFPYPFPQGAL